MNPIAQESYTILSRLRWLHCFLLFFRIFFLGAKYYCLVSLFLFWSSFWHWIGDSQQIIKFPSLISLLNSAFTEQKVGQWQHFG